MRKTALRKYAFLDYIMLHRPKSVLHRGWARVMQKAS